MAKMKRVLRCYHCGSILQKDNPNEKGYISPESFERPTPIQILYCNNCFETMKAFNNSTIDTQVSNDILKILDDAIATDALILWVIDLFAFNGTLNPEIAKKVKKLRVVVLGNKIDLFSSRVNKKGIEEYLTERFEAYGIIPEAIRLVDNTSKTDYQALLAELHKVRRGHDVYMLGNNNSGKTTLVNKMLKYYTNKTGREIRSAIYPGTEAEVLELPLSRSSFFYELPDIITSTNVVNIVEKDVQKQIMPKKELRTTTKVLLPQNSLCVGALAAFTSLGKKPTSVKLYSAEGVEHKVVAYKNLDAFNNENLIKKTVRPVSERFTTFTAFDLFEFTMEKDGRYHDIAIEGLCWITLKGEGQKIRVSCPKGSALKECLSKIR